MQTLSIITTITNPVERQDFHKEAINCYLDFADEVVVVDGSPRPVFFNSRQIRVIHDVWDYEWNWLELPTRLHKARQMCTSDWIMRLDIDQLLHEKDQHEINDLLRNAPEDVHALGMQKINFSYGERHYDKGLNLMIFRNRPDITFGKNLLEDTDLCYPIRVVGSEHHIDDELGKEFELQVGYSVPFNRSGLSYYNYDYYFKTKEFAQKEFFRMSRAYHRFFKLWSFGETEERAFEVFLNMQKTRHEKCPYHTELKTHPKYIHEWVKKLTPYQFGWNGWGLCK